MHPSFPRSAPAANERYRRCETVALFKRMALHDRELVAVLDQVGIR